MVEQTRTISAQIIIRGGTSQTNHYLQLLLPGDQMQSQLFNIANQGDVVMDEQIKIPWTQAITDELKQGIQCILYNEQGEEEALTGIQCVTLVSSGEQISSVQIGGVIADVVIKA